MGTGQTPSASGNRKRARRTSRHRPAAGSPSVVSRVSDRSETTPRRDPWSLRLPPSRPAEGAWLAEALRELDEVAGGVDVDGPQPSREVVAEARSLLRHLAGWVDGAPAVDDDADGGVGIEFYGPEGRRLLLIVEADGSAIYQELIAGDVLTERFEDWRQLLGTFGRAAFQRVGVPVHGEVEAHA